MNDWRIGAREIFMGSYFLLIFIREKNTLYNEGERDMDSLYYFFKELLKC